MKNDLFTIEKSTMRDLTQRETEAVGGGTTVSSWPCATVLITLTIPGGDAGSSLEPGDDVIFDDGFDREP